MSDPQRPVVRDVLHVQRKEQLTPHYLRVVLSGDNIHRFAGVLPGAHAKIFVPAIDTPTELVRRTYTVRHVGQGELWIDFVVHEAPGPAADWAARAEVGTPLEVAIKAGRKVLVARAASYVLVADASAIPVTAVLLESLPPEARAVVVGVVDGPEEEQALPSRAQIEVAWIHAPAVGSGPEVVARLGAFRLPAVDRCAHLAGETKLVGDVRDHLVHACGWRPEEVRAHGYWKADATEDGTPARVASSVAG